MPDRSMQGVYPIIAMPFDNKDRVCVENLQREADFIAAAGREDEAEDIFNKYLPLLKASKPKGI